MCLNIFTYFKGKVKKEINLSSFTPPKYGKEAQNGTFRRNK